jgi:hypothetical protein
MKPGDIVQLKQPFKPEPSNQQEYSFGVIAGRALLKGTSRSRAVQTDSLLLHLYDPQKSLIYTDELGAKAVYLFQLHEVEPCRFGESSGDSYSSFVK